VLIDYTERQTDQNLWWLKSQSIGEIRTESDRFPGDKLSRKEFQLLFSLGTQISSETLTIYDTGSLFSQVRISADESQGQRSKALPLGQS
jgi:hypothetical protein